MNIRSSVDHQVLHFKEYFYQPSLAAAIIFVVLFGIAALLHVYQMIRTKTWFMVPFVIGASCESTRHDIQPQLVSFSALLTFSYLGECIGYIGRTISSLENPGPYALGPFVLQSVLLLVSPAFLAASIYMMLGRIVLMLDASKLLFIRRNWLTQIFVTGDVICFLCQAGGAGLLSSGDLGEINIGDDIIVAGLFIQVVFFGLFVIAAATFHYRLVKTNKQSNGVQVPLASERPWKKHMAGLYIVSILIFVRSIVRCAEYIEGFTGYIITHEAFLYCFDATAMFFAVVTMNWAHPGEVAKHIRELKDRDTGVEMTESTVITTDQKS